LKPQITIYNEDHVEVGATFPRRAKQLVNSSKARWTDASRQGIIMLVDKEAADAEEKIWVMNPEVNAIINELINKLFADIPQTNDINSSDIHNDDINHRDININDINAIKKELAIIMGKALEDLLAEGIDKDRAIAKIEGEYWDVQKIIKGFSREKSIVKDAYRENVSVVMRSSPFDIIKRSKKQTRMLHIAFSAVLWTGALLVYLVANYFLGNMYFTLDPERLSGTWLIFIFALLIECSVEIYFSKKELEVLSENIDLRQINPNHRGDMDLRGYQKRLIRKISVMTHAVVWIPLVLLFFIAGYSFDRWNVIWMLLLLGVFVELLLHFMRRLTGMKKDGYGLSVVEE